MATTYKRFPVVLTRGQGCTVWDEQGRAYTDFIAGIAVCSLGHCHPAVTEAICRQAATLCHVSNLYYTVPQVQLARWLVDHSFADRVFFCNSGAEANEAAIKLARKYFYDRGQSGRYRIVAMEKSFHGRTLATLSATGQEKIRKGFSPVLERFDFVPFGDIDALRAAVTADTCAVMLEPIQGEGGVNCPPAGYLAAARQACDAVGALLIYDEIQTGMGRTGTLFGYQHEGVAPDIMTLAKALANGLPVGAMCAREAVAAAFSPGSHATTFGGTPLVTAAALAVARTLVDGGVLDNCQAMGRYFKSALQDLQSRHGCIRDVRGRGLLLGVELDREGGPVVNRCLEKGFLVNCIQDRVLRLAPPLVVGREQIDALIACLDEVLL
jgi:acetylornithine aminotransferase